MNPSDWLANRSALHQRGTTEITTEHERATKRARVAVPVKHIAKVRCDGAIHAIEWHERGRVTLHGHPKSERATRATLRGLGGERCRCEMVMDEIKKNHGKLATERGVGLHGHTVRALKAAVNESVIATEHRHWGRRDPDGDAFMPPPRELFLRSHWITDKLVDWYKEASEAARLAMYQMTFAGWKPDRARVELLRHRDDALAPQLNVWRSLDTSDPGSVIVEREIEDPTEMRHINRRKQVPGVVTEAYARKWDVECLARVSPWWLRWHNLGLGIVDGLFVVDVHEIRPDTRAHGLPLSAAHAATLTVARVVTLTPLTRIDMNAVEPPLFDVVHETCEAKTVDGVWRLL